MTAKIQIKETDYPVTFNFNTYRKFCALNGLERLSDFDTLFQIEDPENIKFVELENQISLAFEAIKEGCRIEGVPVNITIDDMFAEMTERPQFLTEAMGIMASTQPAKEWETTELPTAKKKKKG